MSQISGNLLVSLTSTKSQVSEASGQAGPVRTAQVQCHITIYE